MGGLDVVLAKAPDVVTCVELGACALGIAGKDTIMEHGGSFYEVLDLGFGKCRFALAAPKGVDFFNGYKTRRVASKYPRVAREYFLTKNMDVSIIKIEGSVELAPILGLADGIVDIVESGNTLKANGLAIVEEICPVSARLIVNAAALKLYKHEIVGFIDRCREVLIK
jgi:ATP phosphoribosyltransferase